MPQLTAVAAEPTEVEADAAAAAPIVVVVDTVDPYRLTSIRSAALTQEAFK